MNNNGILLLTISNIFKPAGGFAASPSMKKGLIIFILFFFQIGVVKAQLIPTGISLDSVYVNIPSIDVFRENSTYLFYYYKPLSYDSATSPLLFAIHGDGGNGMSEINDLIDIAERRKALIVAPNLQTSGSIRIQEAVWSCLDSLDFCTLYGPSTDVLKVIYKHVVSRENKTSIPSYMIGFSAGGQFVTRYMLIRQAYPDSIPLKMAVSSNPYYYTFPTDTFNGIAMPWLCGLLFNYPLIISPFACPNASEFYHFNCNENVVQYYNENYGVLIGTGDIQQLSDGPCGMAQGNNRYERALNFYNFCDSNAVNRGTTLQWQYAEVPGVGHDQHAMYNNKVNVTDSSSIAETLLFDTPYHNVPSISPVASFYADTTLINVNDTVHFINTSYLATSYLWDFGDSVTSNIANPWHVYTTVGTKTVQLTAINNTGCNNWTEKRHYIKVQLPTGLNEINASNLQVRVYPNPATDFLFIDVLNKSEMKFKLTLYNIVGEEQKQISFSESTKLNIKNISPNIYFYKVMDGEEIVGVGKVIKF